MRAANTKNFNTGLANFFRGVGGIRPDPGNEANAPGDPPIPGGTYQFVQTEMVFGPSRMNVPVTPPAFVDWGQYGVQVYDPSGNTGGGVYSGDATETPDENDLYFDASTGLYYDLGN